MTPCCAVPWLGSEWKWWEFGSQHRRGIPSFDQIDDNKMGLIGCNCCHQQKQFLLFSMFHVHCSGDILKSPALGWLVFFFQPRWNFIIREAHGQRMAFLFSSSQSSSNMWRTFYLRNWAQKAHIAHHLISSNIVFWLDVHVLMLRWFTACGMYDQDPSHLLCKFRSLRGEYLPNFVFSKRT